MWPSAPLWHMHLDAQSERFSPRQFQRSRARLPLPRLAPATIHPRHAERSSMRCQQPWRASCAPLALTPASASFKSVGAPPRCLLAPPGPASPALRPTAPAPPSPVARASEPPMGPEVHAHLSDDARLGRWTLLERIAFNLVRPADSGMLQCDSMCPGAAVVVAGGYRLSVRHVLFSCRTLGDDMRCDTCDGHPHLISCASRLLVGTVSKRLSAPNIRSKRRCMPTTNRTRMPSRCQGKSFRAQDGCVCKQPARIVDSPSFVAEQHAHRNIVVDRTTSDEVSVVESIVQGHDVRLPSRWDYGLPSTEIGAQIGKPS